MGISFNVITYQVDMMLYFERTAYRVDAAAVAGYPSSSHHGDRFTAVPCFYVCCVWWLDRPSSSSLPARLRFVWQQEANQAHRNTPKRKRRGGKRGRGVRVRRGALFLGAADDAQMDEIRGELLCGVWCAVPLHGDVKTPSPAGRGVSRNFNTCINHAPSTRHTHYCYE